MRINKFHLNNHWSLSYSYENNHVVVGCAIFCQRWSNFAPFAGVIARHSTVVGKQGSMLAMFSGLFSPSTALLQPVAFAVHFQDMNVVRQAVEERAGEAFGAEDFGPLVGRQVRSDQDRATLVAQAEDPRTRAPLRFSTTAQSRGHR